jgi:hypothetical protein
VAQWLPLTKEQMMTISNATAAPRQGYGAAADDQGGETTPSRKQAAPIPSSAQLAPSDLPAASGREGDGKTALQNMMDWGRASFGQAAAGAGSGAGDGFAGGAPSWPRPTTGSPPAQNAQLAAKPTVVQDLSLVSDGGKPEVNPAKGQEGFAQKDARWAGKDDERTTNVDEKTEYLWNNEGQKFANVGCTVTSLTNGLRIANPASNATPDDAHKNNELFKTALRATRFTDLSGQGKEVKERWFNDPEIQQMKPVNVQSDEGKQITRRIKESLEQGQPVLLGFRNDPSNGQRHSVLAVGVSEDGKLRVIDSWDGQVKSLNAAFETIDAKNPAFDYAYAMRNQSKPELQLSK